MPETAAGFEPLCAIYSKRCLKQAEQHLKENKFKIQWAFRGHRIKYIPESVLLQKDPELISFFNINTPEDLVRAEQALKRARDDAKDQTYFLYMLDQRALRHSLFPLADLLDLIDQKPPAVELVITGRNAAPEIIEKADLVTEMKEVKHPFQQGMMAQRGFDEEERQRETGRTPHDRSTKSMLIHTESSAVKP